ncbi:DNA gyrase subunit B [Myxococcus qinghaiensis]|uniref:DNA gyrase subunit B n=1 Tax=Myxococcus qinghaiensis TaxID=2906758 RepID=UPI0020A6F5A0|nr:DNA gyrase subunit B [Myxococcus qinghaiensis]MCP3170016.1 DNA gyrase subunit B [Myxococcus qinghaiensis]
MRTNGEELRQAIRRRPGMYIGDTYGYGLTRLAESLLLVGVIAGREGRVREISLSLGENGSCGVSFDGWPWPLPSGTSPIADVGRWLTFVNFDRDAEPRPGMPRGVIFPVPYVDLGLVNALASALEVTAWTGGQRWRQRFREGLPQGELHAVAPGAEPSASETGLHITFTPDATIFDPYSRFSVKWLKERLASFSAFHAGISWRLRDEVSGLEARYQRRRGLPDYCVELSDSSQPIHAPWSFEGQAGTTQVRLALQWGEAHGHGVKSWANLRECTLDGTHHDGLVLGLRKALRARMKARGTEQEVLSFTDASLLRHLTAVVELVVPDTVWYGPTQEQLANPEAKADVSQLVSAWVEQALASHPDLESRVLQLSGVPLS